MLIDNNNKKFLIKSDLQDLRVGKIFFKRSRSNFFLTLTDLNNKVLVCKTSGSVLPKVSKRRKISPQTIEDIMHVIRSYIKLYKLDSVIIVLRTKLTIYIRFIIKELEAYNIPIFQFRVRLLKSFNGMRKRKLRRL